MCLFQSKIQELREFASADISTVFIIVSALSSYSRRPICRNLDFQSSSRFNMHGFHSDEYQLDVTPIIVELVQKLCRSSLLDLEITERITQAGKCSGAQKIGYILSSC